MVATQIQPPSKIHIGADNRYDVRMKVANRFHNYLREERIDIGARFPYGEMRKFIKAHIHWTTKGKLLQTKTVKQWYTTWRASSHVVSVLAGPDEEHCLVTADTTRKSRADSRIVLDRYRRRAFGGGGKWKVPCVREALYERFTGIRYAIDWKKMVAEQL